MGKSLRPSMAEMLAIMRHLADVAAMKSDPTAQRQLLVDGINAQIGGDTSFFYVADEWRSEKKPHFVHMTVTTDHDRMFGQYVGEFATRFLLEADPYCYTSIRDDAPVAGWTIGDTLPHRDAERRHSNFLQLISQGRYGDGMISHFRCGAYGDRVVGIAFHRFGQTSKLTRRQLALAKFAMDEMKQLMDRGHLTLPSAEASRGLPPRLQQVMDWLFAGKQPKRIARELNLSVHTIREHIQRLYMRYDVSGREELMSRFLRP